MVLYEIVGVLVISALIVLGMRWLIQNVRIWRG